MGQALVPGGDMPNVKGTAFASRLAWIRRRHGEEGVERALGGGSALMQVLAGGVIDKADWYPFGLFCELCEAIDRTFGRGDLALVRELGRFGADESLTTVYRLFLNVGCPEWILERAARLWSLHYDAGHLQVTRAQAREVRIEIVGFPTPHRAHCLSVLGWAERSLELSGAKELTVAEVSCRTRGEGSCAFEARWN